MPEPRRRPHSEVLADAIQAEERTIADIERKMAAIKRNKTSKNISAQTRANLGKAYSRHQKHLATAQQARTRLTDQWIKHRRWEGHPQQQLERSTA